MPLDKKSQKEVVDYVQKHLASAAWHATYFDFIDDPDLAKRLGEEFLSIRYIYKMLEAIAADKWLHNAQIRIQILLYASIYEAAIHHILFNVLSHHPEVKKLKQGVKYNRLSIPRVYKQQLEKYLKHDGKTIIPMYKVMGKVSEPKIRFDSKAECAEKLGLITPSLKEELIELYEARNTIHIHAEIRKNFNYQMSLSRMAYRRMQIFKKQVSSQLKEMKKLGII